MWDEEYLDDEMAEEFVVRKRAEKMGIEDTPELRRFIAKRDSFSISDEDLEKFADENNGWLHENRKEGF